MTTIIVRYPYHGHHDIVYDGGESHRANRIHLDRAQGTEDRYYLCQTFVRRNGDGSRHQTDVYTHMTREELQIFFAAAGDLLGLPYTLPDGTPRPVRKPINERRYERP